MVLVYGEEYYHHCPPWAQYESTYTPEKNGYGATTSLKKQVWFGRQK